MLMLVGVVERVSLGCGGFELEGLGLVVGV